MANTRAFHIELLENGRLAVSFPYNEEIISRLRALTDRKWDPENRHWEVSIGHLAELQDIFKVETAELDRRIVRKYQMYRIRHGRAKITAGNVDAVLTGVNLPIEKIDRSTSFFVPGYRYMTRFKKGSWDGRKHLFNSKKQVFPSGLAPKVARITRDAGIDCDIQWPTDPDIPKIEFPPPKIPRTKSTNNTAKSATAKTRTNRSKKTSITLRPYQQEAIDAAIEQRRGVIEIATGGGKTLIASRIIRALQYPTLFLVHTRDLLYQAIEVFRRELNIPIGIAGDGQLDIQPVTVATIQTCARAIDIKIDCSPDNDEDLENDKALPPDSLATLQQTIRSTPVVFFDECHHLPADTAYSLAMEMESAIWRYGLSATPYRADRQDILIEAALGPKIFSARASYLIEHGYLVPPNISFLPVPPLVVRTANIDYQEIYTSYVIENKHRNRLIAESALDLAKKKKSVLILVSQVRHGEILRDMIPGAPLVQGTDTADERTEVFNRLRTKKQLIVIATTLADEGLDIPSLDGVILASAGRSPTRALQRLGRALRTHPHKTHATIIDFMDNAPYLREHATSRLELFRTEPQFQIKY